METVDFTALGLTHDESKIYSHLIESGAKTASKIAHSTGISRPLAYRALDALIEKSLIEKTDEPGAVSLFTAKHPSTLETLAETRVKAAEEYKESLSSTVRALTSKYNLLHGKPGVQFFEGEAGILSVLEDTLQARETIYSYADLEAIEKHIPEINRNYSKKRERLQVKKKGLILDTPENRFLLEGYHTKVTESKLIAPEGAPFKTVMQIYDGKISYFTLGVPELVGVIISDPNIYDMHRRMFEMLWVSPLAKIIS